MSLATNGEEVQGQLEDLEYISIRTLNRITFAPCPPPLRSSSAISLSATSLFRPSRSSTGSCDVPLGASDGHWRC